jgi:hypothetical protein
MTAATGAAVTGVAGRTVQSGPLTLPRCGIAGVVGAVPQRR